MSSKPTCTEKLHKLLTYTWTRQISSPTTSTNDNIYCHKKCTFAGAREVWGGGGQERQATKTRALLQKKKKNEEKEFECLWQYVHHFLLQVDNIPWCLSIYTVTQYLSWAMMFIEGKDYNKWSKPLHCFPPPHILQLQ